MTIFFGFRAMTSSPYLLALTVAALAMPSTLHAQRSNSRCDGRSHCPTRTHARATSHRTTIRPLRLVDPAADLRAASARARIDAEAIAPSVNIQPGSATDHLSAPIGMVGAVGYVHPTDRDLIPDDRAANPDPTKRNRRSGLLGAWLHYDFR